MKIVYLDAVVLFALVGVPFTASAQTPGKPPITLDEFMNATEITGQRISPDGSAVVISTTASDWQQNRFKQDLWLWTKASGTVNEFTHSGHDWSPQWSPDGKTIAFLSDRALPGGAASGDGDGAAEDSKDEPTRVWLISMLGGEPIALYREKFDVHAFAWSSDGAKILLSGTEPLSKDAEGAHKAEWKT